MEPAVYLDVSSTQHSYSEWKGCLII
jgi:hypothetical protein